CHKLDLRSFLDVCREEAEQRLLVRGQLVNKLRRAGADAHVVVVDNAAKLLCPGRRKEREALAEFLGADGTVGEEVANDLNEGPPAHVVMLDIARLAVYPLHRRPERRLPCTTGNQQRAVDV